MPDFGRTSEEELVFANNAFLFVKSPLHDVLRHAVQSFEPVGSQREFGRKHLVEFTILQAIQR